MLDPVALDYLEYLDPYLRDAAWEVHFCITPRRCLFTNRILWLRKCYRGRRVVSGPGGDAEFYYASTSGWLLWALK